MSITATLRRCLPVCAALGVAGLQPVGAQAQTVAAAPPGLPTLELPDQSTTTFHRDGLHSVYMLFQRRPVLVLSWRADDETSVERAVPAMLALSDAMHGDLALLCVERSGLSYVDMLRFAAGKRWLGGSAAWTCEVPPGTERLATPSFVLTSVSHATVLAGDPLAEPALKAAVEHVVGERRQGPEDWPPAAREAIEALRDGRLARALELADDFASTEGRPKNAAASTAWETVPRLVSDDLDMRRVWNNEMLSAGLGAAARPRVEALAKALASLPRDDARRQSAESDVEVYTCGDQAKELEASAELLRLQDQLVTKGPSDGLAKALRKCAKSNPGTHAAERALALAVVAAP